MEVLLVESVLIAFCCCRPNCWNRRMLGSVPPHRLLPVSNQTLSSAVSKFHVACIPTLLQALLLISHCVREGVRQYYCKTNHFKVAY